MSKQIFMILVMFVFLSNILYGQNINVALSAKLVIGADENAPEEYLFSFPKQVVTDSKNNIYIADEGIQKIRVFDENGSFIKYIGHCGQGPGEFQEILSMTIDKKDNLIVVDRKNVRVTKFSDFGEKYKCYRLNKYVEPWQISCLNKNEYIFYYNKIKSSKPNKADKLLHIYSDDFKIEKSFASAEEIYDFKEPFQIALSEFDPYASMCVIDSTKVLFVQRFNYGCIYVYKFEGNNWKLSKFSSKKFHNKPFKLFNANKYDPKNLKSFVQFFNSEIGRFYYEELCSNMGVFLLNDGKIAHFFFVHKHDKSILYMELFNLNGKYIGYGSFNNLQFNEDETPIDGILWKDKEDNFYVRARVDGFPVVRVLQLKYSIK